MHVSLGALGRSRLLNYNLQALPWVAKISQHEAAARNRFNYIRLMKELTCHHCSM
jgi:hypothetical protein